MMQMLSAAGLRCPGKSPAFEDSRIEIDISDWTYDYDAIKVLDPHRRCWYLDTPAVFIWIDRDHKQQMKSFDKFGRAMAGLPSIINKKGFIQGLRSDTAESLRTLKSLDKQNPGGMVMRIRFEALLQGKIDTIANELGLDAARMRSVILPRSAKCYDGFLETRLI